MPLLRDFTDQVLQWKRPRFFSTTYELCARNEILATLSRAGVMRAKASAEEQQWIFQREGQRRLQVYSGEHQQSNEPVQPLASIQTGYNWNGNLTLHNGRTYTWTHSGNWRPIWSWRDPEGKTLLTVKKGRLLEIASVARDLPDLALLALLSLYLMLMKEEEETTTLAASVVVS